VISSALVESVPCMYGSETLAMGAVQRLHQVARHAAESDQRPDAARPGLKLPAHRAQTRPRTANDRIGRALGDSIVFRTLVFAGVWRQSGRAGKSPTVAARIRASVAGRRSTPQRSRLMRASSRTASTRLLMIAFSM